MSESSLTIGSLILSLVFSVFIMAILSPLATTMGVFNPTLNGSTASGKYINSLFGSNGIIPFVNTSLNVNYLPFASAANSSLSSLTQQSLAQTSGWAFIAGGFSLFGNSLWNFPRFIWVMLTETFSYQGLGKLIPIDIADLLSVILLTYTTLILSTKIISIISKPGQSVENI